jgi:predicted transcriptional regulator
MLTLGRWAMAGPGSWNQTKEKGVSIERRNPRRAEMVHEAHMMAKYGKTKQEIAEFFGVAISTVHGYFNDPTGERGRLSTQRYERRRKGITAKEEARKKMNRLDLPISDKITMRPVWKRRQRRIYGQNSLPPPNDAEKADAIRILGDQRLQRDAPALYFEAFTIMDEAGV